MLSIFFRTKKKHYNNALLRINIEEEAADKRSTRPAIIDYAAIAIHDSVSGTWLKYNFNALPFPEGVSTFSEMSSINPDFIKAEIDHTFFSRSGLTWHIVGDDRFHFGLRTHCAKFIDGQASMRLGSCQERFELCGFLKSYCRGHIHESSPAYEFFPL